MSSMMGYIYIYIHIYIYIYIYIDKVGMVQSTSISVSCVVNIEV